MVQCWRPVPITSNCPAYTNRAAIGGGYFPARMQGDPAGTQNKAGRHPREEGILGGTNLPTSENRLTAKPRNARVLL